jgi:hypothetical protein
VKLKINQIPANQRRAVEAKKENKGGGKDTEGAHLAENEIIIDEVESRIFLEMNNAVDYFAIHYEYYFLKRNHFVQQMC